MEFLAEWTFEGGPKCRRVGVVGNRTRYQSGVYVSTCVRVDDSSELSI